MKTSESIVPAPPTFKWLWGALLGLTAAVVVLSHVHAGKAPKSNLKSDETLILFPVVAWPDKEDGSWHAEVHGWVFELEEDGVGRRALIHAFAAGIGLDPKEATTSRLFRQRALYFLADNERGKRVVVTLGERPSVIGKTGSNGHVRGQIQIRRDDPVVDGWVTVNAVLATKDKRRIIGRIQRPDAEGVTVISDIDDTIKVTDINNKSEMLRNTFQRPFKPVPGMAEAYRTWEKEGAIFHYISAAPWQLYVPLDSFMTDARFPKGAMQLRVFRWKDRSVVHLFDNPGDYKRDQITLILEACPRRRFIFVGDSGQHDPEIYGRVARRYPRRVIHIFIRNVSGEGGEHDRYKKAFADIAKDAWTVFEDPADLKGYTLPAKKDSSRTPKIPHTDGG